MDVGPRVDAVPKALRSGRCTHWSSLRLRSDSDHAALPSRCRYRGALDAASMPALGRDVVSLDVLVSDEARFLTGHDLVTSEAGATLPSAAGAARSDRWSNRRTTSPRVSLRRPSPVAAGEPSRLLASQRTCPMHRHWLQLWLQSRAFPVVRRRSPWLEGADHGPHEPQRTATNAIITAWQCGSARACFGATDCTVPSLTPVSTCTCQSP
jgi:hypothetical protein